MSENLHPRVRVVVTDTGQTDYEFDFGATSSDQVALHVQGMEEAPAYTISLNEAGSGGSVTFETGLSDGAILTIYRSMAIARASQFNEGAPLQAASLNVELDNSVLLLEQAAMQASDALRKPIYDDSPDLILPDSSGRAGKMLGFDEAGAVRVYDDIATSSATAEEAASQAQAARQDAIQAASTLTELVYWRVEYFSGTGAQQSLPLTVDPGSSSLVFVTVDGVERFQDSWALANGVIEGVFPAGTDNVQIRYGVATPVGEIADQAVTTVKLADGAVTQAKIDPDVELGGPSVGPIRINPRIISEDLTLQDKYSGPVNGMIAGPLTIVDKNELTRSEDFGSADWDKTGVTVSENVTNDPNGVQTADKLGEDTSTGYHRVLRDSPTVPGNVYTFSIYLKAGQRTRANLQLVMDNGLYAIAKVNLVDGGTTFNSTIGDPVAGYDVAEAGNGWWRVSVTERALKMSCTLHVYMTDDAQQPSYTGVTSEGLYLWGAQLCQTDAPTAYASTADAPAGTTLTIPDGSTLTVV